MGVTDFLLLSCLGFAITAHAQDCSVPVGGPNMHLKDEYILKETFASGDQAAFACNTGYISDGGSSSITCTAGSWSTVRLTCKRKTCGSPGDVEHGHIDYPKGNLFGDHMEITCNDGYRLVGKSRIICGAQGWMDRLPRCEVVTCDLPPLVSDATFTPHKDSYDHGEAVRYSCTAGLTLSGPTLISCSNNGTFQPAPPTCVKVECEDLDILNADWISGSRPPHGHKAVVEYKCRKGFKMVGQSTLICEINSQWSPKPPRCEKVDPTKKPDLYCEGPHVKNGYLTTDAQPFYKPSDKVTYKCSPLNKMDGESTLTCQPDGQWSPPPPTCGVHPLEVVGVTIGTPTGVALILGVCWYCGLLPCCRKKQGHQKPKKAEDEVAVSEAVCLKQSPTGNGQESGGTEDKPPVMSPNNV
ncbi:C4b-binding protein alpha chain-like isoform X2 [Pagrus major]|uniref:C4b-binding protein alpha chain-like isoform X2 n=1 Tax=Pagrus major TaxID=143350 RepID=UPI003CC8841F